MAATFNPGLSNPLSRVRQRIGDTGDGTGAFPTTAPADLQDATINAYLNAGMSETQTAARCAWDLYAKYSRMADIDVDNQLQRFSHIAKNFKELAIRLDAEAGSDVSVPTDATQGPIVVTGGDYTNRQFLYGLDLDAS